MNKHLQTIFDCILQSDQLKTKRKDALLKALNDADKELETLSFKLDRTEKNKKTMAILLGETITDLEQKRKSIELQNRELEIESSLERVRGVAMGTQWQGRIFHNPHSDQSL